MRIELDVAEIIFADQVTFAVRLLRFALDNRTDLQPVLLVDEQSQFHDAIVFRLDVMAAEHVASAVACRGNFLLPQGDSGIRAACMPLTVGAIVFNVERSLFPSLFAKRECPQRSVLDAEEIEGIPAGLLSFRSVDFALDKLDKLTSQSGRMNQDHVI